MQRRPFRMHPHHCLQPALAGFCIALMNVSVHLEQIVYSGKAGFWYVMTGFGWPRIHWPDPPMKAVAADLWRLLAFPYGHSDWRIYYMNNAAILQLLQVLTKHTPQKKVSSAQNTSFSPYLSGKTYRTITLCYVNIICIDIASKQGGW